MKKLEGDLEQASSAGGDTAAREAPAGGGEAELALDSMEAVLRDQRNRFKDKLQDCEAELAEIKAAMRVRDSKIGELMKDNTSLYGKVRYLQSYTGQQLRSGVGDLEAGTEDPMMAKYKDSYETTMDPFSQFKSQERQLQMQKLNVSERVALSGTRLLLSNKYARHFAFFYALFMHTLVFVSMWHAAHFHPHRCHHATQSHAEMLKGFHGR